MLEALIAIELAALLVGLYISQYSFSFIYNYIISSLVLVSF